MYLALDALIAANPDQVEKARVNAKLAGWFTGQVLKSTGGKANPAVVNRLVAGGCTLHSGRAAHVKLGTVSRQWSERWNRSPLSATAPRTSDSRAS